MIISPLLESIILFSQISVSGTEARSQCVACGPLIAIAYLLKPRQLAWDSPHAHVQLLQSWYFCHPMDYRLPGSSVHGVLQARILEWVATPFSRGSSWLRDGTCISCASCIAGRFFTHWGIWEALGMAQGRIKLIIQAELRQFVLMETILDQPTESRSLGK